MLKRAGRYEILAELGRGGFGQVYRAKDPTLDSLVAIKTLSVDNDAAVLARFRNEAAASRRLRHPNIVTIYDFGEQDGLPFIVMELLEGQDLQHVIEGRKPLPLWHKIQIMIQVASGLADAHAHGIVHRDVKPANIMLLPDGNVKIMDFGIALVSQETQNRLTPRGAVIGTFRYMAPEQFRGSQQDARGDIFAYGVVFYELLSGIHPFHAPEPAAAMYNILNLEPVSIRELCPECPEQLDAVISRLLQKDPEFRYQNLEDVLFDCEPILQDLKRDRAHDLFEEVKQAHGSGHIETAQVMLRQVMELDPSYPGARDLRERLQAELRRSAVRPRIEALSAEALAQMAAGNPAEALQKFESALRLDPSDFTLKSWIEQAKAALEQSRQVARLLADAERALRSGDLTGAHRIARQAAELAPSDQRVRETLGRTEAALAEQERQSRLTDNLAKAQRLVEIRSWDQAAIVVDQLEREFPRNREVRDLLKILHAGRLAEEQQQKLSAGLLAARHDVQGRNLEAARARLEALHSDFPSEADVEQLLRYVTSEIEVERQREVVNRSLSESRALAEQNQFAAAAEVLEAALGSYPNHPILRRELRSATTALQKTQRDAALNQALSSAKALQAQGNLEEALAPLESFSSKYGPEPAIEELHRAIGRDREAARRAAELRKMVLRINNLLSQDQAEEATLLLEASPTPIKAAPEITQLRVRVQAQLDRQKERRAALDQALADADAHRQRSDFDHALRILEEFTTRYGADPKIGEIEKSIRRDQGEAQRRAEEFRNLVNRASEFLAEGKPAEATQLLRSRPGYFQDDAEVTKLLDEAELQVRKQGEREAALQEAISAAGRRQQQGQFEEALELLEAFLRQYGADGRVTALQQTIRTSRDAARRAEEIRQLETRAQSLLDQNDAQAAAAMLQQAPSLVNESDDLRELLRNAQAVLAAQQAREFVQATVAQAQSRANRGEFQAALAAIDGGLQHFPAEPALQSARAEVVAAQAAQERDQYRAQIIAEVNALIARHDYSRASSVQEKALGKLAGDLQIQSLKAEIEAHRRDWEALQTEQKIQDTARRAHELLQGKPAESVALIEKLCAQHPNRPELITQLNEAREAALQAAERELIQEAEKLCEKEKFSEAIAKLTKAGRETAEVQAARQRVESRWAAAVNERIAKALQSAQELAARKPAQAVRDLEKLRKQFPGRPEIESAIENHRQALLEQERAREEARRQATEIATAASAVSGTVAPQVEPQQVQTAAPISRRWIYSAAGIIAAGTIAVVIWWIAHAKHVPPAITLVPIEVRTDPQGASVRIGDQSCVTPKCQLDLRPGTYSVQAQLQGYESVQQALSVRGAQPASLDLTLRPLRLPPPPPTNTAGRLIVQTGLPDVSVIVDNLPRGRTDASGNFGMPVEAATHTVRVEKAGYEAHEQRVKVGKLASETVAFRLAPEMATLELRGAPAGVELHAGSRLIGRTNGSLFSAAVPPGDQLLRVTQDSASREISQRFDPGRTVALNWPNVAPTPNVTPRAPVPAPVPPSQPPPPQTTIDPAEQDWTLVRTTSNPEAIQNYLNKYPNTRHIAEARSLLDSLAWSRVNQNDLQSLRDYLSRFQGGAHTRDASERVAALLWNSVNQKDEQGVRSFIEQNPNSPYKTQAQAVLDQLEKRRLDAEAQFKQELAKQEEAKQLAAQRSAILAVLDRLNAAFAQHKERELKAVWQKPPQAYLEAVNTAHSLVTFDAPQVVNLSGNTATVQANVASERSQSRAAPVPVKLTLQKRGDDWVIVKLERQ